jgi:hypothetical protein
VLGKDPPQHQFIAAVQWCNKKFSTFRAEERRKVKYNTFLSLIDDFLLYLDRFLDQIVGPMHHTTLTKQKY